MFQITNTHYYYFRRIHVFVARSPFCTQHFFIVSLVVLSLFYRVGNDAFESKYSKINHPICWLFFFFFCFSKRVETFLNQSNPVQLVFLFKISTFNFHDCFRHFGYWMYVLFITLFFVSIAAQY